MCVQLSQLCMPNIALGIVALARGRKSKRACYVSLGVSLPRESRDLDKTLQKRRNVPDVRADFCSWYPSIGPWKKIQESTLCESGSVFAQGILGSGQDVAKTSKCPRCTCRLLLLVSEHGSVGENPSYVSLGVSLKTILTLLKLFFRLPPVRQCLFGSRCSRSSFSRALVSICEFFR